MDPQEASEQSGDSGRNEETSSGYTWYQLSEEEGKWSEVPTGQDYRLQRV